MTFKHNINKNSGLHVIGICFFMSGFSALLYQIVWMRLAMSNFGVTTPVIASVISVFLMGLAAGSYIGGKCASRAVKFDFLRGIRMYALLEGVIGIGGFAVPYIFSWERSLILSLKMSDSVIYFSSTLLLLFLALFPFCLCMGATYPFALSYLKHRKPEGGDFNFSFLYLMNMAGSLSGVILPTFITIELMGFRNTLIIASLVNFMVCALAFWYQGSPDVSGKKTPDNVNLTKPTDSGNGLNISFPSIASLFILGLSTMGMEVIWTRLYQPYCGPLVYTFASILGIYLLFNFAGTCFYRYIIRKGEFGCIKVTWYMLGPAGIIALVSASPQFDIFSYYRVIVGIGPLSFITGMLTPYLIDNVSKSLPRQAGTAYASNLIGSVLGPVITGFFLLEYLGPRHSIFVLCIPLILLGIIMPYGQMLELKRLFSPVYMGKWAFIIVVFFILFSSGSTFESQFPGSIVYHDHTATVMATGTKMDKKLFVNGHTMTHMTPITKMMAHLPVVHLSGSIESGIRSGLVVCMGMGTSLRSLISWNMDVTAVELVPSVVKLLPYFFNDIDTVITGSSMRIKIIVDDGRRFLDRSLENYDVITIDPPPPLEHAVSSLIYSVEFYSSVKARLKSGGIIQTWIPNGDPAAISAIIRSLMESFSEVRVFRTENDEGYHCLASNDKIPYRSAEELASQLTTSAYSDLKQWSSMDPVTAFKQTLQNELNPATFISNLNKQSGMKPDSQWMITDDHAVNEYYILRNIKYLFSS